MSKRITPRHEQAPKPVTLPPMPWGRALPETDNSATMAQQEQET
jgi:hypothetical protein